MPIIEHPYEQLSTGRWLRGNLHAHTNRSDGTREPQEVIDDYAGRGYEFLMLSDHDVFTSASMLSEMSDRGMILIPGNEITDRGPHLLHINADRLLAPHAQRQRVLNEAAAHQGFIVVCHPNWQHTFDHCSMSRLAEWTGYVGVEVYNGVIGRLDGSPYATNKWDMLLTSGRRVWGFANDDSHYPEIDVALGWNMVFTADRTVRGIVDALVGGRFYASTGVVITGIEVRGNRICIETDNARRIVALQQVGRRFATVDDSAIEVEVPVEATYVRFECWGEREQFAWTQPFFIVNG